MILCPSAVISSDKTKFGGHRFCCSVCRQRFHWSAAKICCRKEYVRLTAAFALGGAVLEGHAGLGVVALRLQLGSMIPWHMLQRLSWLGVAIFFISVTFRYIRSLITSRRGVQTATLRGAIFSKERTLKLLHPFVMISLQCVPVYAVEFCFSLSAGDGTTALVESCRDTNAIQAPKHEVG